MHPQRMHRVYVEQTSVVLVSHSLVLLLHLTDLVMRQWSVGSEFDMRMTIIATIGRARAISKSRPSDDLLAESDVSTLPFRARTSTNPTIVATRNALP